MAFDIFGIGINMLVRRSCGRWSVSYILLMISVEVFRPSGPKHCKNSAGMLSTPEVNLDSAKTKVQETLCSY